jgi:hypothetical protein
MCLDTKHILLIHMDFRNYAESELYLLVPTSDFRECGIVLAE